MAFSSSKQLTFDADRNQLFTAWNAIANLADLAGKGQPGTDEVNLAMGLWLGVAQ